MTRRGLTLVELLMVLVLIGILALWSVPPLLALRDGSAVQQETRRIVEALDMARGAAVRLGTTSRLILTDSSYQVSVISLGGDSIVPWRTSGAAKRRVTLTGGGAALLFGPAGIAMGVSNRTITLTRGRVTKKVVISRLGRLTY